MLVIHGIWAHGALCLWAEDPGLPPASATRPASPGPASPGPASTRPASTGPSGVHLPRPHPFAAQAAELADLLAGRAATRNAAGHAARKAVQDELTLQLPS